jgi:hypothetical protein
VLLLQYSLGFFGIVTFREDPVVCLVNGFWQVGSGFNYSNFVDIDVSLDQVQGKVNPQVRPIRDMQKFSQ